MEIAQRNFRVNIGETLNIYFLGDIHEGNVNHAEDELKEAVKIIKNDPNGYWIGMGDYIEAITLDDKKRFNPVTIAKKYGIEDLKDLPFKQCKAVFDKIRPIEDKCLALLIGNHEESYVKYNHSNVYDRFGEMFTTMPAMLGYVGFFRVGLIRQKNKDTANHVIVFALNHGIGGGGFREGYPINKIHDVFRWTDADINIMGHIHQLVIDDKKITGVTYYGNLNKRRRYFGSSGCFLWTYKEGNANYYEHKGKHEGDIGFLKVSIKLLRDGPDITLKKIILG